ncbi:MAG TPA: hypothetical protein VIL86_08130 [Tepidisphaeraceae bacterium]|jgi:phosphotriesterase-related protein
MPFIRTVLGDIPSGELGVCYAHEHIIIDESFTTLQNPDFLLDDIERVTEELKAFHAAGGRAMVDTMPADSGRNVHKLAEVSRRTGVHIICPTGLHLQKYYPPGHWSRRLSATELAELFVADIDEGVDANDYGGPEISRTDHCAGVIKVAGEKDRLNDHQIKLFTAAALAHKRTGCPIITHTEQGTAGLEQIEIFAHIGVDLHHVTLSHTDRKFDLGYHRELLGTGVNLVYEGGFRWKPEEGNPTLKLITALIGQYPDQIMLGMDAARRTYWKSFGGAPGLAWLLTDFTGQMRKSGVSSEHLHKIFQTTPERAFSFSKEMIRIASAGLHALS